MPDLVGVRWFLLLSFLFYFWFSLTDAFPLPVAQDDFSLFGSSTLIFLNISHNDIETFPSFALFPSRRLRVFDARHNAPEFTVSYAGLGPAMRYCGNRGPPLVLLDDSDHCYPVGKTAEGIGSCYYVTCGGSYGRREECDDGVKRFVPFFTECDGIDDGCQDESICLSFPAIRSSEGSSEQDPFCQDIADCFPGRASLHFDGDLAYLTPLVDGMDPSCPMHVDVSTRLFFTRNVSPWRQEIVDGPRRLTMEIYFRLTPSFAVVAKTMYHSGFSKYPVECWITYEVTAALDLALLAGVPDDLVPATTTQRPAEQSGGGAKQSAIAIIVVAVVVSLVLLVAGVVVVLYTRRRNHVLHPYFSAKVCRSPLMFEWFHSVISLSRAGAITSSSSTSQFFSSFPRWSSPQWTLRAPSLRAALVRLLR
jgi:hypothetical protein